MMLRNEFLAELPGNPEDVVMVEVGGVFIDVVQIVHRPDREYVVIRLEPEDAHWVLEYAERHGVAALQRRREGGLHA
jgi:hypothetical protein